MAAVVCTMTCNNLIKQVYQALADMSIHLLLARRRMEENKNALLFWIAEAKKKSCPQSSQNRSSLINKRAIT
jgi:hypothetical protein